MKPKQPHKYVCASAVDCDYCRGTGKAPSLGLDAGVIDLCHHCNGLGKTDAELGPYHVDIVIQIFQGIVQKKQRHIDELQHHFKGKDPIFDHGRAGKFGAKRSD